MIGKNSHKRLFPAMHVGERNPRPQSFILDREEHKFLYLTYLKGTSDQTLMPVWSITTRLGASPRTFTQTGKSQEVEHEKRSNVL
jgi:hypothetical protein